MSSGRVLGLDPGERRVGVALSDPLGIIAQPHSVIDRNAEDVTTKVRELVAEFDVAEVVVGLPVSLSGVEGPSAQRARALGEELAAALEVPVIFFDERFTSVQAEAALLESGMRRADRKGARDKVAAALILQGYMDGRRRDEAT